MQNHEELPSQLRTNLKDKVQLCLGQWQRMILVWSHGWRSRAITQFITPYCEIVNNVITPNGKGVCEILLIDEATFRSLLANVEVSFDVYEKQLSSNKCLARDVFSLIDLILAFQPLVFIQSDNEGGGVGFSTDNEGMVRRDFVKTFLE